MLVDEVEKLINEGKIVACNISDLRAVNIEKDKDTKEYMYSAKRSAIDSLKNRVTFLYKIDEEHYMEYYSKTVVTVIDNIYNKNNTFEEFQDNYKNNFESSPITILKRDILKVGSKEKEAFRKNKVSDIDFSSKLEQVFLNAKDRLKEQYQKACLEQEKKEYVSSVFKELEGNRVFIVRISDLQNIVLLTKKYNGEFRYGFKKENRTNFQPLETTNFTLLIEKSPTLYEEYYSEIKVLAGNTTDIQKLLNPSDINELDSNYNFFLETPLVAARELQEYNEETKDLIADNFDKKKIIAKLIKDLNQKAAENLENEYYRIEKIDELDSYVDNALVDMVLRLRNENTDD